MPPVAIVKHLDDAGIKRRRDELLREIGLSEDALRAQGALYQLDSKGLAALQEIDDLDYLLAHSRG